MSLFVGREDLQKVDIFQGISEFALTFLAKNTRIRRWDTGKVVAEKGQALDCCYFILDGACHIRTPESGAFTDDMGRETKRIFERHQGFRGIGDSIGITAALAHYAHQKRGAVDTIGTSKQRMRTEYESLMNVGLNTANTYAIVPSTFLECPREVLLTAVQICPVLIANIAWALSLRMQQDTLLQQRAAQKSNECLPVLAQFVYEWAMVRSIYYQAHPGADRTPMKMPGRGPIGEWLRISDTSAVASAFRFLAVEKPADEVLMERSGLSRDEVLAQFRAIDETEEIINPDALLAWCRETVSRELIAKEVPKYLKLRKPQTP